MFGRLARNWYDPFDYQHDTVPSRLPEIPVFNPREHLLNITEPRRGTGAVSKSEKYGDYFKVMLNVKHFRPDEIKVKTVDNFVVIHAKHEERADQHGYVSREFTRRYQLPDNVEPQAVKSSLNKDGVLTIFALWKDLETPPKIERVVPVTIQESEAVKRAKRLHELQKQRVELRKQQEIIMREMVLQSYR